MREVITFQFEGQQLVGTFHRPAAWPSVSDPATLGSGRVALLWLNSGYLPRSPVGDVVAHLADRLAADGLGSFRLDLPGLGDSQGTLADDTQTYFSKVARGLNVDAANAVARDVCGRLGFKGVIMGGICGASITSIYAAASSESSGIVGLLLLDPSFKLVQPFVAPTGAAAAAPGQAPDRMKQRLKNFRIRVLETRWGQGLRVAWRRCKPLLSPVRKLNRALRAESLPADANRPLFDGFCGLVRRQFPMLVLLAGDQALHAERFDYVDVALRSAGPAVTRHYLPATNHSFVEGNGEADVCRLVSAWLAEAGVGLQGRRA